MFLVFALVTFIGGTVHASSFNTTYPAFVRMNFSDRELSRLRDLNMVNKSFQGVAQVLHKDLNDRVDTQGNSCEYLLLSNPTFRMVRKVLLLTSYLERSCEIGQPLVVHVGKLMGIVIKYSNKPEYFERAEGIVDAWLAEIKAAGECPVNFNTHFADDQRMLALFEFAMWLNSKRDFTWSFTDFHTKK